MTPSSRALAAAVLATTLVLAGCGAEGLSGSANRDEDTGTQQPSDTEDTNTEQASDTDEDTEDPTTTTTTTTTTTIPTTSTTTIPVEQLRAELDAEVQRACQEVQNTGSAASGAVLYQPAWTPTGIDRDGVIAMVDACVQQALEAEIANAGPIDVDTVIRNPEGVRGQVVRMIVRISQFDAATGVCGFRGNWDDEQHESSLEYAGDNAIFSAGDGTTCPVLDGIDQNDTIRVWARGAGAITYDNQIGGSTTAPSFEVLRTEVLAKE